MTIQKKSMLSSLTTTKKAIIASHSEKPNVAAPVSARLKAKIVAKATSRVLGKLRQF